MKMNFIMCFEKLLLPASRFWNQKYDDPFKKIDIILTLTTQDQINGTLLCPSLTKTTFV